MTAIRNDLDLKKWKDYSEILTDSLWLFDKRDNSGVHTASYAGNFVPQIPRQLMLRYTGQGEVVVDPFLGGGTTLIESQRLGRNGLGLDLNPASARQAEDLISSEANPAGVTSRVVIGDALQADYPMMLAHEGWQSAQLVILHPPYHNIIHFSDRPNDLSNLTYPDYLHKMGELACQMHAILDKGRVLALVISDKYERGEWVSMGFDTMKMVEAAGFTLLSTVVKNFNATSAKRNQESLWRYRALAGGYFVFKHEYIFLFKKK